MSTPLLAYGYASWNTLELHGQIGLAYDMSVAFNDAAGYRLGIGQPSYPWHPDKDAMIPVLQVPSLLMDGASSTTKSEV